MRDFERPAGRLAALPFHARLAYTIFATFTLAGLLLTLVLAHDMVGVDGHDVRAYYAGERAAPHAVPPPHGGPDLELPVEDTAPPVAVPMARRKLLETTHFHLFSLPIYLLVLSHLYMLSRASSRAKTLWIGAGTLGVATHIAAPWVAAYAPSIGRAFFLVTGTLLFAPMLWMCVAPLLEMWQRMPPAAKPAPTPPPTREI